MSKRKRKNNKNKVFKKPTKEEIRQQDAFKTWRFIITFFVLFIPIVLLMFFGPKF